MKQALLLDRNFMPMCIVSWRKAMKLLSVNKVEVLEEYEEELRSEKLIIKNPAVIRLTYQTPYHKAVHSLRVKFSRYNVFIRDNFMCRYCGAEINRNIGTIDHVVPKSAGGKSTYENCVTCCKRCNRVKGNLSLAQSGFKLVEDIRTPTFWEINLREQKEPVEIWAKYLQ